MMEPEEAPDLVLESHNIEITDEEPDPIRRRASVHRAASYLSDDYPPHGSSHGQEGGSIVPQETIEVFGLAKLYEGGCDVLGAKLGYQAAPRRAEFRLTQSPGGRKVITLNVAKTKLGDPRASVANAREIGKRSVDIGKKLMAVANKAAKTRVRGAAPARKPVGKRLSPAALRKVAQRAIDGGKDLLKRADKLDKIVKVESAKFKANIAQARGTTAPKTMSATTRTPSKVPTKTSATLTKTTAASKTMAPKSTAARVLSSTRLRGEVLGIMSAALASEAQQLHDQLQGEIAGDQLMDLMGYYDASGQWIEADPSGQGLPPTPTDPALDSGYDDSYVDTSAANNYGLGPAPTEADVAPQEGIDFQKDPFAQAADDPRVYRSTGDKPPVAGAIYYTGQPQLSAMAGNPVGSVGSRGFWSGDVSSGDGFAFFGQGNPIAGQPRANNWKFRDKKRFGDYGAQPVPVEFTSVASIAENSESRGWGPLVGQPGGVAKGLRFDVAKNAFFWFYDQAPDNMKRAIIDQRLTEAMVDFNTRLTAAKAEAAAKALADQIEQQEYEAELKRQAKEDADRERQYAQEQRDYEHAAELQRVDDEAALSMEERMLQMQEEAEARQEERMWQMQMQQQEAEEQRQIREEERLFELAQRADEAAQQSYEEPTSDGSEADAGEVYAEEEDAFEQAPLPPIEEPDQFLGLRAIDRLRARLSSRHVA